MATITSTGNISDLVEMKNETFNEAAETLGIKLAETIEEAYSDLAFGNFRINEFSGNRVEVYLFGAQGEADIVGSGLSSNNPKFSQIDFRGNDGLKFGIRGSFGLNSFKLSESTTTFNGDAISLKGSLNENGLGKISKSSVTSDNVTLTLEGSITSSASGESGSYKSVQINDNAGNVISIKSNISYDLFESLSGDENSFADVLDAAALFAGNDKFTVTDGVRVWQGFSGNDSMTGGSLGDKLRGDDGNDKLIGNAGNDILDGGSGNDKIDGGTGNDQLSGGSGNDKLTGGDGNDLINSGSGADKVSGGAGGDTFIFDNLAIAGFDKISDFKATEDKLMLDTSVFTALAGGISAENLVVGAKPIALEADDFLLLDSKGGKLFYDADGSGAGAAIQIASLTGVSTLNISNFIAEPLTS
ncbi:calcium-binding protein [Methylobacillus flagellatus]|uniref:calcium-binding protein n=1 Tax=Methylobacillus flagellatus TaxID=405 RepID=UPI0010F6CA0E|nr:calcium-binding protein [Methylobacillus flagellatus]